MGERGESFPGFAHKIILASEPGDNQERLPNPVPGTLTPSAAVIEREIRQRVKKLVRQEADFWSSLIYWHGRLILKQADQTGGWGPLATEKSITDRQVSV